MEISEIINEIKNDIECQICLDLFIKLTYKEYDKFLKDNEKLLPYTFEDDTCCCLYQDRFECLVCKNIICQKCIWSLKNHKFIPDDWCIDDYEYFGELDEDGFADGVPGQDCPIICPFCRTKDYKIFYGNQIPYEILNEIKNNPREKEGS